MGVNKAMPINLEQYPVQSMSRKQRDLDTTKTLQFKDG